MLPQTVLEQAAVDEIVFAGFDHRGVLKLQGGKMIMILVTAN